MLSEAPRVPDAVGVNVTLTWQVPAGARGAVQVFVWVKSPGLSKPKKGISSAVKLIFEIVSGADPVLVTVSICGGLVIPIGKPANVKLAGETAIVGYWPWSKIENTPLPVSVSR